MSTTLQNAIGDAAFGIVLDHAVKILDEAVKANPEDARAIAELVAHRVICSDSLGDHPTIQVGHIDYNSGNPLELGMLGILNGVLGADSEGSGYLAACYNVKCGWSGRVVDGRVGQSCACGGVKVLGELTGFMGAR